VSRFSGRSRALEKQGRARFLWYLFVYYTEAGGENRQEFYLHVIIENIAGKIHLTAGPQKIAEPLKGFLFHETPPALFGFGPWVRKIDMKSVA